LTDEQWEFSSESSKSISIDMRHVQRLSPDGRVKLEANARRKISGLTARIIE